MSELDRINQRIAAVEAELRGSEQNVQRCQGALQVLAFMRDEATAAAKAAEETKEPAASAA